MDLIAAADIRYASSEAKFSVREAKVAIVADIGSLHRLPPIIGDGHLRELAFTGKDIDAARAEKIGLVNDVFDTPKRRWPPRMPPRPRSRRIPPLVVQGVKDVLGRERENVVADGLKYVSTWNAAFLPSEDLQEAIGAVFEKREPDFKGR